MSGLLGTTCFIFKVYVKKIIIHSAAFYAGLSFGCPKDCPALDRVNLATEGVGKDYTFVSPSFTADSNTGTVTITILDDDEHEMREYFCLYVTDEEKRGSQWYARITIPWNDCKCFADYDRLSSQLVHARTSDQNDHSTENIRCIIIRNSCMN